MMVAVSSYKCGFNQKFVSMRSRLPRLVQNVHTDSKLHVANMGPTWVLSAPAGSHVGPMKLANTGCRSISTTSVKLTLFFSTHRFISQL